MKICVSIDLDNYQEYQSLVDADGAPRSFYTDAVPRFLDDLDRAGVRATFFMVGRDAEVADHRRAVREIAARGHEVGNHSYTHPYNFRCLSRQQKETEIRRADEAIADILGERPVGFRTPSCDVDSETLAVLAELGYHYDSSVFPSPLMWVFMIYGKLFVRHDDYQLGSMMAAFAPAHPYVPSSRRVDRQRKRDDDGAATVLEIPFSVLPFLRAPFYSTLLRRFGPRAFTGMLRAYGTRRPELHTVFHLIELADFDDTPLGRAFERMPALAVPLGARQRFISHALASLAAAGEPVTMRELADDYLGEQDAPDRA